MKPGIIGLTLVLSFFSAAAEVEDNSDYSLAYSAWAATHFALLPTSFLPGPIGAVADLATIGIDIHLKHLPAFFVAPTAAAVVPDTPDPDTARLCTYTFDLPQKEADYQNLFGFWDIREITSNWGDLGQPLVAHGNSEVSVRVESPFLADWTPRNKEVSFPSGVHPLRWSANTQLDKIFDIAIPAVLFIFTAELKYGDAITKTDPKSAARATAIGREFLKNAAIEAGVITGGTLLDGSKIDAAVHNQIRSFTVLDVEPPEIQTSEPTPAPLEATDFGGERWERHKERFRATITATDPCLRPLSIGNDAPFLLQIGTNVVTWTASDTGPVGGGNPGFDTVTQTIVVQDTKAPILLTPPSRVVESNNPASNSDFDVGTAVVFDLADPEPVISNTVPAVFPVNSRTEITWTATDASGNASSKSQWVTVKGPGTNTPPSVLNTSASTLTSQPVDITLIGSDSDLISGIFDPLKFQITRLPPNGFFVAPLMPYFIEDYRVKPIDEVGEILNSSNPSSGFNDQYCTPRREIPVDFVYMPEFVHVTDAGDSYVLDKYWFCSGGAAQTDDRLSKWDSNGNLVDANTSIASSVKRITMDSDGFVYTVTPGTASEPLFLTRYDADLEFVQSWKLDANTPFGTPPNRMLSAKLDSVTGIIYASDKTRVYAYDGGDGNFVPAYLGTLKDGETFLSAAPSVAGSSSRGFYFEIDAAGAVYIVDSGADRIHKFASSSLENGIFTPGNHIGWLGRCDSGPNCDDANGRSFGYSCTDTTCTVTDTAGSGQGQFRTPIGIALDDEDTLYVTDYDNSRVQRFTALGDFAGVAASTCDGSCFVLGDMGRPLDISVNATKFHVLDRDRDLMHVFETAPFKEITDSSVVVSYASDNAFQGTDSFNYIASDGLASSNTGIATITVERNFRAPEAFSDSVNVDEDGSITFDLPASDPDGIAGVDFNGLDSLRYIIVSGPSNGTLTGSGSSRSYAPAPDFNGSDKIVFRVNDGLFDSPVAVVDITVQPVNDPPVLRLTDDQSKFIPKAFWPLIKDKIAASGATAGLGFPLPLMAEFTDPDDGQPHFLSINWGDGSSDSANQNPPDPKEEFTDPIITPNFPGLGGQVMAEHTFAEPGLKTIELLVFDGDTASAQLLVEVDVIPMVDVSIEGIPEAMDPTPPGSPTTLLLIVTNELPADPVIGIDANEVELTARLPAGVELMSISTTQGACSESAGTIVCQIGSLAPDRQTTVTVTVLPPEDFNPEDDPIQVNVTAMEPDASGENLITIPVPSQSQTVFVSGFE